MRRSKLGAVSLLLLASAWTLGCHSGEIRLYKSRSMRDQVWMKKLDPDIFKTHEESVGLTLKISAPGGLASVTPASRSSTATKPNGTGRFRRCWPSTPS